MNWSSLYVAVLKRENQRRKVGCFVGVLLTDFKLFVTFSFCHKLSHQM